MTREEALTDLRRIQRHGQRILAVLVRLGGLAHGSRSGALLHFLRNGLEELAERSRGRLHALGRHVWLLLLEAPREAVARQLAVLFDIECTPGNDRDRWRRFCELFDLPAEYVPLRESMERAESVPAPPDGEPSAGATSPGPRAGNATGDPAAEAETAPQALSGRLDARRLGALLRLLDGVDLAPFVRRQAVWRIGVRPEPLYVELFTSLADIARVHFPGLVIDEGTPLALELRRHLDSLLLAQLLIDRPFERMAVGLNLTRGAIASPEFGWLVARTRPEQRARCVLELPWQEVVADLAAGGDLCRELRAAGFTLAVDGVGPGVLDHVRPQSLDLPIVKLVFDDSAAGHFTDPAFAARVAELPAGTLVLARCDRRPALTAARQLGIRHLQGWLVDRFVREQSPAADAALREASRPEAVG
jgi:EAL domain-containing protein (putative c-di-GMP-specific phosphodiesterase class I)